MVIGLLTLSCAAGVLALAEPALLALVVPDFISGRIDNATRIARPSVQAELPADASNTTDSNSLAQVSVAAANYTLPVWSAQHELVGFPSDGVLLAALCPDGVTAAIVWVDENGKSCLRAWRQSEDEPELAHEIPVRDIAATSPIHSIAVSPGGTHAAIGRANGRIDLVALGTAAEPVTVAAHGGAVLALQFGPDGRRLYSGGGDGFLKSLAMPTLTDPKSAGTGEPIRSISIAGSSGFAFAVGEDGGVTMVSLTSFRLAGLRWAHGKCRGLAVSGDGLRYAAALQDGRMVVAAIGREGLLAEVALDAEPTAVLLSPNGRAVLVETPGGMMTWDASSPSAAQSGFAPMDLPSGVPHCFRFGRSGRPLSLLDNRVWMFD